MSSSAGSRRPSSGRRSRPRRSTTTCSARSASAARRREHVAARREPSLEQFLPRRGDGLALSASDIDLYRTCPLKYKFARVFAIPQEPTINQRFGILIHQVLERFHAEELRGAGAADEPMAGDRRQPRPSARPVRGRLAPQGFGASDDELQYRDRAVAALTRYQERNARAESRAGLAGAQFLVRDRAPPAARPGRPGRPVAGRRLRADRLQDRRPGPGPKLTGDVQLALYRLGAREAWQIEAEPGSYWYVLADQQGCRPARARRRRAGRAHRARGRRRDHRPGLRAAAVVRDLLLVRLPPDLPRQRGLALGAAAAGTSERPRGAAERSLRRCGTCRTSDEPRGRDAAGRWPGSARATPATAGRSPTPSSCRSSSAYSAPPTALAARPARQT